MLELYEGKPSRTVLRRESGSNPADLAGDLYTLGEKKCALYAVIPDNDNSFNFLVSLLYAQAFQALYYSADQIHHGALPQHVHFVLDEFAAMPMPGFTRELATMRSRNISASTIIQNMAQIKALFKDDW